MVKKWHIGFVPAMARCQQSLAGTRRADQQHALGNASAQALEFLRVAQEVHDFLQIVLGFIHAGDVFKRDAALTLGQELGARFAEAHRLAAAGLHLAQEKHPDTDQQQHGEPVDEDADQRRHAVIGSGHGGIDIVGLQHRPQGGVVVGHGGGEGLTGRQFAFDLLTLEGDFANLVLQNLFVEFRIADGADIGVGACPLKQVEQEHQKDRDQDPQTEIAQIVQDLSPFNTNSTSAHWAVAPGYSISAQRAAAKGRSPPYTLAAY